MNKWLKRAPIDMAKNIATNVENAKANNRLAQPSEFFIDQKVLVLEDDEF